MKYARVETKEGGSYTDNYFLDEVLDTLKRFRHKQRICFLFLTTFLFICLWFYRGNKIKGLEYQLNQCKDVEAVYRANNDCLTNANLMSK
jgi:hypothetical protein